MRSRGYVLNPLSQRDNRHTSWSTAPKKSSLPTSRGIRRQRNNTTKAYLKIADKLTLMDSKKISAPPSCNQQGTLRVSDTILNTTSRNAPSTLAISSSTVSRTRKDYTSSARPGKAPSQLQR
jgi:hypothetical protein